MWETNKKKGRKVEEDNDRWKEGKEEQEQKQQEQQEQLEEKK